MKKAKGSVKINELQKEVWDYGSKLETHTVETHIYRLRKKIKEKFNDDKFIISSKEGYTINWKKKINLQKTYLQKNIRFELLNQRKGREVLKEKKLKSSSYLLNNLRR